MATRAPDRLKYRQRIDALLKNPPGADGSLPAGSEVQSHWAKYVCVLVSGYLEQSLREVLLEHTGGQAAPTIFRYVAESWPSSKNMSCLAIGDILGQFDVAWNEKFEIWLKEDERKKEINEIIKWRNSIAHGNEASTNNVTINTVKKKFAVACSLVDFVEGTVLA